MAPDSLALFGRFLWPAEVTPELSTTELATQIGSAVAYLDVRTVEEYEAGHVPGAYNVPWQHGTVAGLQRNPDFEASIAVALPRHWPLIVGCHSGTRAAQAAAALRRLGFSKLLVHREGWDGSRDAFGRRGLGWNASGNLVEHTPQPERGYPDLHCRTPTQPLRIAYFGLPLGALLLQRDGHALQFVVLPPVAAPGKRRLRRSVDCPILDAAEPRISNSCASTPHASELAAGDLNAAIDARFAAAPVDLLVSWFWTRRLPAEWLARPLQGAIGVHPSLLPRHRGPNPYFGAIDSGDAETGVSVHRITPAYDEGEVLLQSTIAVAEQNAWQLARALDRPSLALLRQTVQAYATHHPPRAVAQDNMQATWAPEPAGDLLGFEASWSVERVLRRVRALCPVPGLTLNIQGLELIVSEAFASDEPLRALEPGQAAVWGEPPKLLLRMADGAIALERALVLEHETEVELRSSELAERVRRHLEGLG